MESARPSRWPATDKPFRVRGVSLGELNASGKVRLHRDYWDPHRMDDLDRTGPGVGPVVSGIPDIVRHALDEAGIVVAPDELEMLVAAYETVRGRAASLYLPDADSFEPADVFLAGDAAEEGK